MVEQEAPVRRRRLGAHGLVFRRRRIFASLREGLTYGEIAVEEGVSVSRIRQIVSEELRKRAVDNGADHAKLQLDRLAPALQLGAEAIAAGDISAINPYLKALDRLDRYQSVAGANQAYDDEARRKLFDKLNRLAENLGLEGPGGERIEAKGEEAGGSPEEVTLTTKTWSPVPIPSEPIGIEASHPQPEPGSGFLHLDRP